MTTFTIVDPDDPATEATSATATSTAVDFADRERLASRREAVLATAIVVLIAAVVVFGLVFPELLAPAVGIAVLAVIVALEWLLPSGELHQRRRGTEVLRRRGDHLGGGSFSRASARRN